MYILNLHIPPFWEIVSHSFISFHSLLCVSQFFIDFGSHCHMPILSVDLECFLGFISRPFFWLVLYSGRHIFTIQEFAGMYYSVSPCGLCLFFRTAASPRISLRKYIRIYFKCVPCPLHNVFPPVVSVISALWVFFHVVTALTDQGRMWLVLSACLK